MLHWKSLLLTGIACICTACTAPPIIPTPARPTQAVRIPIVQQQEASAGQATQAAPTTIQRVELPIVQQGTKPTSAPVHQIQLPLIQQAPIPTIATAPITFTTIPLAIGEHPLSVELATLPEQRTQGLMQRKELPDDHGMLFVFPQAQALAFWMHNTLIPLDIAFLDDNATILNIEAMQPLTDVSHYANGLARYALEVNQGWFANRNITAGMHVSFQIPPEVVVK